MTLVPLSPVDHVFTGRGAYPIEFVFAYAGRIDEGRLEESLRRALEAFPPASSRLVRLSADSLAFEPCGGGCTFRVADSGETFAAAERRTVFLDPVGEAEGEPLGRVLLTKTPDGCVLGVSLSHAVVDGYAYFQLLSGWARLFRGEPLPPPSHAREGLIPRDPGRAAGPGGRRGRLDGSGVFREERRTPVDRGSLRWDRHLFTRADLASLHEEAQRGSAVRLSHNDVVAAWLWKRTLAGRAGDDPSVETWLSCPVDFRRLLPAAGPAYFGCAVALATASIPRGALPASPLGDLATRVRRAVDAVDAAAAERSLLALERLRLSEGLAAMEECHPVHPRHGLLLTNLSRLPVADVAFGAGPPVAFDILTPGVRGAVALPAEGGGLDLRVFLPDA